MKVRHILSSLIFILATFSSGFSQLANQNTYLLKNIDDYSSYSACWGYTAPDGREYALIGCFQGTSFVDITDSADIHEVGFLPTSGASTNSGNGWREMKTYSHYAYIVSEAPNSGIQIVDLQYLPDSIRYVGKFVTGSLSDIHSISQSGPYIYINGANSSFGNGVTVFDLSNPEVPVQRGSWNTRYVHDCRVKNDTIWAMNINNSDGQVTVINAANKDSLVEITNWLNNPNPSPHNCDLTADSKYLLTTDEVGNSPPRLLKVWDVQNLNNPVQVNTWQPTGITTSRVHNVERLGNYAVIAHYSAGIRIVDISNPLALNEVAWYDTYPNNNSFNYNGCWGVYAFPSGKIIGSDIGNGLFVIKTTFPLVNVQTISNTIPQDFSLQQNYPNPFNPSTKITFSIPKGSSVSIKVFDAAGKEVATILNGKKEAGSYEITFDAGLYGLTSGIYFYRLTTPDFTQTKRMILVK
jgi:choice-of-anchor B domain-containing protein